MMPDVRAKNEHEGHPPPPPKHDMPPHIFKELLELREKIGRLEGMMEVLLQKKEKSS